jgi:hypothetical protein
VGYECISLREIAHRPFADQVDDRLSHAQNRHTATV